MTTPERQNAPKGWRWNDRGELEQTSPTGFGGHSILTLDTHDGKLMVDAPYYSEGSHLIDLEAIAVVLRAHGWIVEPPK